MELGCIESIKFWNNNKVLGWRVLSNYICDCEEMVWFIKNILSVGVVKDLEFPIEDTLSVE